MSFLVLGPGIGEVDTAAWGRPMRVVRERCLDDALGRKLARHVPDSAATLLSSGKARSGGTPQNALARL
jgi:hypothetical protein